MDFTIVAFLRTLSNFHCRNGQPTRPRNSVRAEAWKVKAVSSWIPDGRHGSFAAAVCIRAESHSSPFRSFSQFERGALSFPVSAVAREGPLPAFSHTGADTRSHALDSLHPRGARLHGDTTPRNICACGRLRQRRARGRVQGSRRQHGAR